MKNFVVLVKIKFALTVLFLTLVLVFSISILQESTTFTFNNLVRNIDHLRYQVMGARAESPFFIAQSEHSAQSIPVLLYHGLPNEPDGKNVILGDFRDQMIALKRAGYTTISMDDFYLFMKSEKQLPDKSILITFDDGRKDSYYPADPVLRTLGFRGVMFVITGFSLGEKGNYYLAENELKQMFESGRWDIQSHGKNDHVEHIINPDGSHGHFLSNKFWISELGRHETDAEYSFRIYEDFVTSKKELEEFLDSEVVGFAFPFGDYGNNETNFDRAKDIILSNVARAYPLAFYQIWPGGGFTHNYPDPDQFMIKRIDVFPSWSGRELLGMLDRGRAKTVPFSSTLAGDDGWLVNWGRVDFTPVGMMVSADEGGTGSTIFLDGSYDWTDYIFRSTVDLVNGRSIALAVRFQDPDNYASCVYSNDFVHIDQVIEGERRVIKGIEQKINIPEGTFDLAVRVRGREVSCIYEDEILVVSEFLDKEISRGGIGFKAWDPEKGNSDVLVSRIIVDPIEN